MRYPVVIGNWKLNGSYHMIKKLVISLRKNLVNTLRCTIVVAPPTIYLDFTKHMINDSHIILGAQDVDLNTSGAFTGETSAAMLKDIGAKYVIIGHSERRRHHKESNELIAKKFGVLKKQNLIPVLCIGESEEDYKKNRTEKACEHQIDAILQTHGVEVFENTVIAYEPVWAIGTGHSANPKLVQEIHKFIRNYIAKLSKKISERVIIQYGGSVNESNVTQLFSYPDIDGVLVGGASLQADSFSRIVQLAENTKLMS